MQQLEIADVEKMVRLLATAGDPTVEISLQERKQRIARGISRLIHADVWIWAVSRFTASDSMAISLVDGGWNDELERADIFRTISYPAAAELHKQLHTELFQGRCSTGAWNLRTDPIVIESPVIPWIKPFNHLLITSYPVGNNTVSSLGCWRRNHQAAFTERDKNVAHLMWQQIDWLHREGTDVPAAPHVLDLSPRERQVMLLLMGGDSRKQVAAKLKLSEHTVGDYLKEIYCKLGVSSRGELLAKFLPGGHR